MVDVIVVGGGHAGCEAALAVSRRGLETVLCTIDPSWMASMPCNPSIGGPAKGIIVREIDALGGQMGRTADRTALQFKMLNTAKGPGVRSLRVQSDKIAYRLDMQRQCRQQPHLQIVAGIVVGVLTDGRRASGVRLQDGAEIRSRAVILTTGTYMASLVMVSKDVVEQGPDRQPTTKDLSADLCRLGFTLMRLKTGTPPRIRTASIDFSAAEIQPGTDDRHCFSYLTTDILPLDRQVPCHLIYTNAQTHQIIRDNLGKSSMYSGVVHGVGPRYCPSIEDKIVRFADKPRHQIFLEPESLSLDTTYVQGFSTSMPHDVQLAMLHTLPGFSDCQVARYSYAIEYDAFDPLQMRPSLETKLVDGLFSAGQINGTSGYEEAAGQGLMAGINAANKLLGLAPLVLRRDEAYIGVMIDDLVTKGTREPYRMLTSRAEYRLLLRHDNADQRLTEYGRQARLIDDARYAAFRTKMEKLDGYQAQLRDIHLPAAAVGGYLAGLGYQDDPAVGSYHAYELVRRPQVTVQGLNAFDGLDVPEGLADDLDIRIKYEGYIAKAQREAARLRQLERQRLPQDVDYQTLDQLSLEARQKLNKVHPATLGQASRISGVDPSDIMTLAVWLKQSAR